MSRPAALPQQGISAVRAGGRDFFSQAARIELWETSEKYFFYFSGFLEIKYKFTCRIDSGGFVRRLKGEIVLSKPRILIIDDEPKICDSLIRVFDALGYQTKFATDGESGLELYSDFQPDVVICDLKMPGISGFDVMEKLLAENPDAVFVVITGYATISSAVESIKKGAFDFLPKPFTPDEIRIITRRALAQSRLLKETAELRREKERMQEKFIAMVSHQLRSPLVAVRQYHDVLLEELAGGLNTEQREILMRSQFRLDELLSLIRDWLSFSRLDEKTVKANTERFYLRTLLDEAVSLLQRTADKKNVKFTLPDDHSLSIAGDKRLLKEALVNCLANAVQYNREGGRVIIETVLQPGRICVLIGDTGIGIPPEDQERVFEEFYRSRRTKEIPGTGLGLAIVKRIIELHGGSVSVRSRPGEGSEFSICLPDLPDKE